MTEHQGRPARPPSASPRWRKGTRTIRLRTAMRATGANGQPKAPVTGHGNIPHRELTRHTCGWCGGPNSHTNRTTRPYRVLCRSCMRAEFGSEYAYDAFIRSERQHQAAVRRKLRKAAAS